MGRGRRSRRRGSGRWGSGRWARRLGGGLAAVLAGVVLSGCAAFDTEDDERWARELAEELYPGELEVVGARILFPQSAGSEVTLSLADDPDAAVRFRVDASKDHCDGGANCAEALGRAIERARLEAGRLRAMRDAFDGCGRPVVATDVTLSAPWIEARVTDGTVDEVLTGVGACVQRWVTARAAGEPSARIASVSVNFAAPGTAGDLPAAKSALPTVPRFTHGPRLAALASDAYYVATYEVGSDAARTVDVASARLRIVSPLEERQEFSRRIDAAVLPLLRARYPDAVTTGISGLGVWRLEPGTIERTRGYVLFCARPPAGTERCLGDLAAVVTADPKGGDAALVTVRTDIRDERGVLRLPPL
ncbi:MULTISPECIES: SCO7460 family lipoprotein [unclassified Streptomyces]|uniref:SCO7460 family lipoprotein n=1 Tax=unclassified Streptomyces TaxID=2593676 RepID=UPI0035E02291